MNDPPDQTAELSAANLLSDAGITVPQYCLKISSFSRKAESVSLKTIPKSSRSFSCYGKLLLIRIEQIHLLNTFVQLQEYLIYQMLL